MLGALMGVIGFWGTLGLIALIGWLADRHPILMWALIFTATSAIAGYAVSEGLY